MGTRLSFPQKLASAPRHQPLWSVRCSVSVMFTFAGCSSSLLNSECDQELTPPLCTAPSSNRVHATSRRSPPCCRCCCRCHCRKYRALKRCPPQLKPLLLSLAGNLKQSYHSAQVQCNLYYNHKQQK